MANKIKLKKDNKDTFCLAYNHVSDTQSVIALDKILIEGVQARAEDIQPKNKNSSVTYRVHDVKSQKLEVVSIIDIGNRPDLEEKLKKARGQGKRRKVPKLKNLTPLARPNLKIKKKEKLRRIEEVDQAFYDLLTQETTGNQFVLEDIEPDHELLNNSKENEKSDDEENEVSQQEEGIGTEEEQFLTDSDLSQFDKSNSLNTEEENNIHINSESRQQINGNKINNSQEVKNNNGNTVQLVPNAKKKNLKQIRIIQSLPIRTNEIELLELEQSLLKEERNKINNRYLHQAEIIRALRKKEQDLKNKTGISEISANIQQYLQNITSNVSELIKSQAVKTTEDRLPNIRSVISVSKSNDSTSKANKISEKTISRNDIEKASKKEVMSQRAKLLVRMKWPDKAIRLQLGFDKNAPGVKILISDEEVIEIRDKTLNFLSQTLTKIIIKINKHNIYSNFYRFMFGM
ncbi:hypothetical protein KQX54_008785 [Cotesia glomerata]|uniref:Uncharacterized protein n=1 Tax=Cotesia glomerata TaxID=32391 RepID=A0AAV7HWB7_COTGL|nr:hypothetical protein KQX54_008785 [Cotesia glomerata]